MGSLTAGLCFIQLYKVEVLVLDIRKLWPNLYAFCEFRNLWHIRWRGRDSWEDVQDIRGWEDSWEGSPTLGKGGWGFANLVQKQWQWRDYFNLSRAVFLTLFLTQHCSRLTILFQEVLRKVVTKRRVVLFEYLRNNRYI